jgi:hypothetical protein
MKSALAAHPVANCCIDDTDDPLLHCGKGAAGPSDHPLFVVTLAELFSGQLILQHAIGTRGKRHAFDLAVAHRRADPDHSAAGSVHAPFLRGCSAALPRC